MESALCLPDDPDFRLIETALWTPAQGVHNARLHLARLARTAAVFGITPLDAAQAVQAIHADGPRRVRLTVDRAGVVTIALHPFTPLAPDTTWSLMLCPDRLRSDDPWLRVKTTRRALYDTARARLPDTADELIFLNEKDEVCEGTITNIFADLGQGLITPPLSSGLLPGVLRHHLLDQGKARTAILTLPDLRAARAVFVGNSLRGLIRTGGIS
ncbi:MAG: aminotransferase class IV family protein [Roseovarius sp.]